MTNSAILGCQRPLGMAHEDDFAKNRIDQSRPMKISGSVTRDLSHMPHDPLHGVATDLARKTGNPAFLRLTELEVGAELELANLTPAARRCPHSPPPTEGFRLTINVIAVSVANTKPLVRRAFLRNSNRPSSTSQISPKPSGTSPLLAMPSGQQ